MPAELAPTIAISPTDFDDLLDRYLASEATIAPDYDAEGIAKRFSALPLMLDWVGIFLLTRDGRISFVPWEEPTTIEPVPLRDTWMLHAVRSSGARRFPTLEGLAPVRQPDSTTCTSCRGTGQPMVGDQPAPDNVMCICGNLGWLPAGFRAP
jgi:glycine/D-amino acid oxidase-like deaminating enzyme